MSGCSRYVSIFIQNPTGGKKNSLIVTAR